MYSTEDTTLHTASKDNGDDATQSEDVVCKENDVEEPKAMFNPPLYYQRYNAVRQAIVNYHEQNKDISPVKKIIDVGCAECKFILQLKHQLFLEHIIGVDIDKELLSRHSTCKKLEPLVSDCLMRHQRKELNISLLHGDITHEDGRLKGADVVTLIEVIEHLHEETLTAMKNTVFSYIKPSLVVMTTPNSEFNILFPNFSGMRHWDHKFEWTRQEFKQWCEVICERYGYTVTYSGVGDPPADRSSVGSCSQMACFTRNSSVTVDDAISTLSEKRVYDEVYSVTYPGNKKSESEMLDDELRYQINTIASLMVYYGEVYDTSDVSVSVDELFQNSKLLKKLLTEDKLLSRASELGYKTSEEDMCVHVNMDRPESSEESDTEEDK